MDNKRFDYFEAIGNPKIKPEEGTKSEKDIWKLQQKVYSKAPATWIRKRGPKPRKKVRDFQEEVMAGLATVIRVLSRDAKAPG